MIIRRFTQHIKKQNWFAVGLDMMVVILGIFFGFQLTEWNEERISRTEEKLYLKRIQADILESIERTEKGIEYMQRNANRSTVILRSLEKCNISTDNEDEFASGLYQLGKATPAFLVTTTIDELRSTGKWNIIQNVEVREKISAMHAAHKSVLSVFSQVEGRLLPHINYVDSVVSYEINEPIGGAASMSLENIKYDFKLLCGDTRFYNAISTVRNYAFDLVSQNSRIVSVYKNTLDKVNREMSTETIN